MGLLEFLALIVSAIIAPIVAYFLATLKGRRDLRLSEEANQNKLDQQAAERKAEIEELKERTAVEIAAAEKRNDVSRDELLQSMVKKFSAEGEAAREQLRKREQELEVAREFVAAAAETRQVAETELVTLKPELEESKRINRELVAAVDKALDANKALANDLRERTEKLMATLEENAGLREIKARFESLQHSFDSLNKELSKRDHEIERLRSERNDAQKELREKLETFATLGRDMVELREQMITLAEKLEKEPEAA